MEVTSRIGVFALVFTLALFASAWMYESLLPIVVWLIGMLSLGALVNALGGGGHGPRSRRS